MMGGNETKWQFLFSLFVNLFQPILAWKVAIIGFLKFLEIFAIFWEFSFTSWAGTKWNDNFYFLYFSAFSNLFWLEMKPQWYYLIFLFFFFFFWNFLLPLGKEWNGKTMFIFYLSRHFPTYFGLKCNHNGIFLIYWIFLLFFLNFI